MTQLAPAPTDLALAWPEHAPDQFAELFAQALQAEKAIVWLQDPALPPGCLRPVGKCGLTLLETTHLDLSEPSLAHQAQQEKRIQLLWTRDLQQLGSTETTLMKAHGLDTLLCLPFRLPDGTPGMLHAATTQPFIPDIHHIVEAAQVAQALTIGLHRARQKDETTRTAQRLQQIVDRSPDMIITRHGLNIVSVNPACHDILGYHPEEMVGHDLREFMHPDDIERNLHTNQSRILQGMSVRDYRNRYLHRDGHVVHLSWSVFHEGEGHIISIARDITDRVKNEEVLRESEQRFKVIADSVPILIWMSDLSKDRIFFNKTWLEFTGESVEESLGYGWTKFVHPEDVQRYIDIYTEHFEAQKEFQIEYRLRRFDGEYRWILATGVPRFSTSGEFSGFIGGCIEMHDRKLIQEALQESRHALEESEARFKAVTDSVPILIWMSDLSKDRVFFNRTWLEFTGSSPQDSQGHGWTQFVHPEDVQRYIDIYTEHFEAQKEFQIEYRLRRHDGEYRWILANGVPRFSPGGEFVGFIGGCIEMHDRRVAQEALRQNEAQLRELMEVQKRFVADAAHEIRTPLAAIQGNLDILIRYPHIDNKDKLEIIGDVQRESSRLGRLVHDMLQLARGDSGLSFKEDEVRLDQVLLDAWRETERINRNHHMVLTDLPRVWIYGDRDRLKQLALILLENATKYTPKGGTIQLSLKTNSQSAEFRVSDSGIGISETDLPRVFERFYRVDKARHRGQDPGGTGLGLPIAKWIVDQHHGDIWMESKLGEGTHAVVRLPLSEDNSTS
ncbi:PAS domain S-box protein [Deinococcus cellulosilyticus]|uniref:histidine kinase n=1 Tax=Deinococcus cellulosilyticus (strain DSM 18568 / NBRC 106333 / KACC 11606 / 5516J-15) TaxID=1223518 RepID=A0A511N763_DEIC1|nr:PAS domain S-box protein [Deinococcus cellulosilyticus]GEM48318.1 hypothetical protein DC3_39530 [Deinococcus cellulosilyticus NBRC 106333 = KACC 11606]